MQKKRFFLIVFIWLASQIVQAITVNNYQFLNANQETQFHHLIGELRCLVCQNQSLADSNAPLAKDLRNTVYQQILEGKSDSEIKQYLVQRYGDYVLFKPPMTHATYILWFGPFSFLVLAFIILFRNIKQKNQALKTH